MALCRSSAIVKLGGCRLTDTLPPGTRHGKFPRAFSDVHVRDRNRRNYAIKALRLKRQAFAGALAKRFCREIATSQSPDCCSSMSSPVTWSAGVTPHETRSRPAPQPRSTILNKRTLQARKRGVNQLLLDMQRQVGSSSNSSPGHSTRKIGLTPPNKVLEVYRRWTPRDRPRLDFRTF